MSILSRYFPPAASLYRRRLLRAFANWGFFGFAFVLEVVAFGAGVPLFAILIYFVVTLLVVIFDDISSPASLLMRLSYWLRHKQPGAAAVRRVRDEQTDHYWPTPLGRRFGEFFSSERYRIVLFLALVLAGWIFGFCAIIDLPAANDRLLWRALLVVLTFGGTAIPFGMLVATAMLRYHWAKRPEVWGLFGLIGPLLASLALWRITADPLLSGLAALLLYGIYFFAYLSQRLWMGERAYDRVIQELITSFLSSNEGWESLSHDVPQFIGKQMSYPRVFILRASEDRQRLQVIGQHGEYSDVLGRSFPVTEGISGRAYTLKKTLLWNDTRQCPYYLDVTGPDHVDDTRSEIAIPICYRDEVYGVLDVQSKHVGVFSAGDTEWLDVIALLLGAVLAAQKSDLLIDRALESWAQLSSGTLASEALASEEVVFDQFAMAAIDTLGARALVYYPLSSARYPAREPLCYPDEEVVQRDLSSWEPHLLRLIAQWDQAWAENGMSYVIPLGTSRECFGLLAWHFSAPNRNSTLLELTLRTLSQGFTTAIALVRYRDIFFDGFGCPDLGIHSFIGRHGLKFSDTLRASAEQAFASDAQCAARDGWRVENCAIFPVVSRANKAMNELLAIEAGQPPDFWRTTLQEALRPLKSSLPRASDGRPPALELAIDALIERESPWLKLAIYRVIVEAIDNAMYHGHATRISVSVQRAETTVEVCIRNNGSPLDPDARAKGDSKRGIFSMLERFQNQFAATVRGPSQEGGMVAICVSIPSLPLSLEER